MPERTDAQVLYIQKYVKRPCAMVVVDCGTHRCFPSKAASIKLKNSTITSAWLAGIERMSGSGPFSAYWFIDDTVIFSREETGDILSKLMMGLYHDGAAVIQPSFNDKSESTWDHLFRPFTPNPKRKRVMRLRSTWFIDNSAALWRSDFFDPTKHLAGFVSPEMSGLEACRDARRLRRSILIDDNIVITKDDNSATSEARYKKTLEERRALELKRADRYFSMKYGTAWRGKLYFSDVKKNMR